MLPSVVSKSTTSVITPTTNEADTKRFSDSFFHLIDNITQSIHLPSFLYYIFLFVETFHILFVSFWTELNFIYDFKGFSNFVFGICAFRGANIGENPNALLFVFIFMTALSLFVVVYLFSEIIFYKQKRRFNKITLYPCRFLLELLSEILILPLCSFVQFVFNSIFEESTSLKIIFLVVGIILIIVVPIYSYLTNMLIGFSPFLPETPLAAFNFTPFLTVVVFNPFFHFFCGIATHFAHWIQHPIIICHLIFMIYILRQITYRPFIKGGMNVYFFTITLETIFLDVMKLISLFFKKIDPFIFFILLITTIILALVLSIVYFSIQKKRINKELDEIDPSINGITEEMNNLYVKLKLDTNENRAFLYMNFILCYRPRLYASNHISLVKFLASVYLSDKILLNCIRHFAFLPAQSRPFDYYTKLAKRQKFNGLKNAFFMFQIVRIKLQRESSFGSLSYEKLPELKQSSSDIKSNLIYFWNKSSTTLSYFLNIHTSLVKLNSMWEEAIEEFPYSCRLSEGYRDFQIECLTDFSGAIKQKYRVDLIESGKFFSIDTCFRQFARNFPFYVKQNIINARGTLFIDNDRKKKGSRSSNSDRMNDSSFSSLSSELDAALEEGIGKLIIKNSRIRLALQHATSSKKANAHYTLLILSILITIVGLGIAVFLFVYLNNYFNTRTQSLSIIQNVISSRSDLAACGAVLLTYWGNQTQAIDINAYKEETTLNESFDDSYFPLNVQWDEMSMLFNAESRSSFNKLLKEVTALANTGLNVFDYMQVLFQNRYPITFCRTDVVIMDQNQDLKIIMNYLFITSALIFNKVDNVENWFTDEPRFCEFVSTFSNIGSPFQDLRMSMFNFQTDLADSTSKSLSLFTLCFPIIVGAFSIIVFLIAAIIYIKELYYFSNLMIKLPNNVKDEAAKPLRKEGDGEDDLVPPHESGSHFNLPVFLIYMEILFSIGLAVIIYFEIESTIIFNEKFQNLNFWISNSAVRIPILLEIQFTIFELVLSENEKVKNSKFINQSNINTRLNGYLANMEKVNKELLEGTSEYDSAYGSSSTIDEVLLKESCEANFNDSSFHEVYRCASGNQQMNLFLNLIITIQNDFKTYNGVIKDSRSSQTLHFLSNHLLPKLKIVDTEFNNLITGFQESSDSSVIGFFIGQLLVLFVNFYIMYRFISCMEHAYSTALILLRRVSPISIVGNTDLINYLLNKKTKSAKTDLSVDHGIIFNSTESVLCTGTSGIVEIVNPAVMKTLGYTPEQLLGQSIVTILNNEDQTKIEQQIQLMLNRQSAPTFEDHIVCTSDDDSLIPCAITILAIPYSAVDDRIKSFVVILKDELELKKQQEEAEKAKKKSETLLYQILPRDIAIRLSQGEKDISFSVPSATIMFIDIVKFSEYSRGLTPEKIMKNLSLLFGRFDESIASYPLLIKIKLIGDVYMCAGGLFTPEEPPQRHAEQMIRFGIDALQIVEDTNMNLSANLNVRIGVNTGGPLIAGVLGIDKPTFDIIGDPINVAARLQSTDIPGSIQISQATYDLVNDLDFQIEPRGEVFLKGKGKTMTYLINQLKTMTFNISSSEMVTGLDKKNTGFSSTRDISSFSSFHTQSSLSIEQISVAPPVST